MDKMDGMFIRLIASIIVSYCICSVLITGNLELIAEILWGDEIPEHLTSNTLLVLIAFCSIVYSINLWLKSFVKGNRQKRFYGLWLYDLNPNTKIAFYIFKGIYWDPRSIFKFGFTRYQYLEFKCQRGIPVAITKVESSAEYDFTFPCVKHNYDNTAVLVNTKSGKERLLELEMSDNFGKRGNKQIDAKLWDIKDSDNPKNITLHSISCSGGYCTREESIERDIRNALALSHWGDVPTEHESRAG